MKKDYTFDAECFALASIAWAGAHQEEYNPALTQQKLRRSKRIANYSG